MEVKASPSKLTSGAGMFAAARRVWRTGSPCRAGGMERGGNDRRRGRENGRGGGGATWAATKTPSRETGVIDGPRNGPSIAARGAAIAVGIDPMGNTETENKARTSTRSKQA